MTTRAITALLATAIMSLPCSSAFAEVFTLKDALAAAYETNPRLASERANLRATDEEVARANSEWHPTANVIGIGGYANTQAGGFLGNSTDHPISGQVVVQQPIFRGGQTLADIAKAKAEVKAERAQLTSTEEGVLLDCVAAYMNVVHDTGALELQRKNVHDLEGALNATHSQRVIGTLTKTDEAQAQASLVAARTALAAAEAQLANSRTTFMRIVGRPAETLEDAPALPAVPKSVDEAVAIALKQNPALIAAQQNVKAADHAVDSADGALLPQISITGTYQYSKDNPDSPFANLATNKYAAVLGQITIPIYQGGGEYATIRQNEELRNKLRLTADEVYREVDDVTRSTWQNLFEAQTAIANGKAQVAANELANEGVTEEQRAGERTVLDTLNAKQALVNAQLALLDATRNSYEATYGLLSAMGQLTAKQQGLNVQLYDPITHYKQDAASWFGWSD